MTKKSTSISRILLKMTILPLLLLGIATTLFAIQTTTRSMESLVENDLAHLAHVLVSDYNLVYPGDYTQQAADDETVVFKGSTIINGKYDLIDNHKELTGVDFSIFYDDVRVITTLSDENGNRAVGTTANDRFIQDVLIHGNSSFYSGSTVLGSSYYAYYEPIYNSDGSIVGMAASLMPAREVYYLILKASMPLLIVAIFFLLLTMIWTRRYSKEFIHTIGQLNSALGRVAGGDLSSTIPNDVLSRTDEFGNMAHSIADMQRSLQSLVEQDGLTHLLNRRTGQQRLDSEFHKTPNASHTLSVALGDIDFFKKFNDTYGHDCGDLVLVEIAKLLQEAIEGCGFAARWGGEEFLLIFTSGTFEEHKTAMQQLMDHIRSKEIIYGNNTVHVTMTFGLADSFGCNSPDEIVKCADNLLYRGKEGGRNRLITAES